MTFDWDQEQTKDGFEACVGCLAWFCFLRGSQPGFVVGREGTRSSLSRQGEWAKDGTSEVVRMAGENQPPEERRSGMPVKD